VGLRVEAVSLELCAETGASVNQHVESDGPELAPTQADERGDVLEPAAPDGVAGAEIEEDVVLRAVGERDCRRGVYEEEGAHEAGDASDAGGGDVEERFVGVGENLVVVGVRPDLWSSG